MRNLIIRLFVNAVALSAAVWLIPGIKLLDGDIVTLILVAAVFGLVNAFIRPILKLLTCPLQILTLGLFTFVLNALMLWLTSWLAGILELGFVVDGFLAALLGAVIISIVSIILNLFLGDD